MKKIGTAGLMALAITCLLPATATAAVQQTLAGTVTHTWGNQIAFKAGSGAVYVAETSKATLMRKNGTPMQFSEILAGDKIEVSGTLWPDNSMNAATVRDLSLYTHTGTFNGKITQVDASTSSFLLQSSQFGTQTIHTDSYTMFKVSGSNGGLRDLQTGMNATVKGIWDRSNSDIKATDVQATMRLVNIDITGTLTMKGDGWMTVVANNVIYSVDISKAKLQKKNGKSATLNQFNYNDTVRVQGKHLAESPAITATSVKDMSVLR